MKKVKILTIVLAIILVTLIAFGGIYLPTQNRMENKVKDYELGRELDSQRVIELKIKENSTDNSEENSSEETAYHKLLILYIFWDGLVTSLKVKLSNNLLVAVLQAMLAVCRGISLKVKLSNNLLVAVLLAKNRL